MPSISIPIAASADDAETGNTTGVTIGMYGPSYWSGYRFLTNAVTHADLDGASINDARIEFNVHNTNEDDPAIDWYAEDVDNAAAFTTGSTNISGRTMTPTPVNWTATGIGSGPGKFTPNLALLVQAVIDRPGWSPGNAICLLADGLTDCYFTVWSRDGTAVYQPTLHLDYTVAGAGGHAMRKTARIRLATKVGGGLAA